MASNDVTIIDLATGEIVERPFTEEELAQREAETGAAKAAAQDRANAQSDAIAHAKSLGFTDAMIAAMYPNLVEV